MSLIIFQHHPDEGPAQIGRVLQDHGHRLRTIALWDGQAVPADRDDVDGILSMGGPMNVDETDAHPWIESESAYLKAAHEAGVPIVGICLGAQLIAAALGGEVGPMDQPEVGWHNVKLAFPGTIETLYQGIGWDSTQFHLHGQEVKTLPPGATPLAGSARCRTQAFVAGLKTYAFQYHFEWTRADIEHFSNDGLVRAAEVTPSQIAEGADRHYADYRRLGDLLCERIALLLFPIDRR